MCERADDDSAGRARTERPSLASLPTAPPSAHVTRGRLLLPPRPPLPPLPLPAPRPPLGGALMTGRTPPWAAAGDGNASPAAPAAALTPLLVLLLLLPPLLLLLPLPPLLLLLPLPPLGSATTV
jgi:hypothetical protein